MATIKFTNSKSSIKKIYNYITQKSKTNDELISTKDCLKISAIDEMIFTKKQFNKMNGRQYIHIVQSFDPKDTLSYETANEIGVKLAEYFKDFQAVICTHTDRQHTHNHILLNSVNFKTGYKFQQSKKDMEKVKNYSDELCLQYGLSIIENPNKNTYLKQNEYQVALKGESWKIQLIIDIDNTLKISKSKDDFIHIMNEKGYTVNWSDNRKYITYTTPSGKKCRDNKLKDKKYSKEVLENEFRRIETKSYQYEQPRGDKERGTNKSSKQDNSTIQRNINDRVGFSNEHFANNRTRDTNTLHRQSEASRWYETSNSIQHKVYRETSHSISSNITDKLNETGQYDNKQSERNKPIATSSKSKSKDFGIDR